MKRVFINLLFVMTLAIGLSCGDDDPPGPSTDTATYEGTANINPNNFPAGIGLDLSAGDTGRVVQLDEVTALEWDINVITYRTAEGGRPGVILFGDSRNSAAAVQAVNVSDGLGIASGGAGFNAFANVTQAMQQALSADDEFLFDPVLDVDQNGRADINILRAAYQNLVIGERIVNLAEADQPVYLVKDRSGNLYKFQMVSRAQGGATTLRWARFADGSIE